MRSILRQIVAVVALVGITTSMVPAAFAASYTAQAAADKLAASGFIVNQSANPAAYRLGDTLLRQEAVGTAANVLGILTISLTDYVCMNKFSDVSAIDGWVCRAAELAANAGLTNAANPSFRPRDNLSRYEALVFALRAGSLIPAGNWSQNDLIQLGADNGIIDSAAGFNSNASATRGEFFTFVAEALDAQEEIPNLCEIFGTCENNGGVVTPPVTPPTGGAVGVSLAANQPSGTIVAGQATAPLLAVAVSGTGTLQTLTLKRSGISDQNTLTNVYLYDGAARLTDGYSFNNAGEITMNNLNLVVNGSRTLHVLADVSASAPSGQTISVAVTGVRANAETTVSAVNVQGNLFSIASGSTLASIALSGSNTVSTPATVNAGTSSYAVWRQAFLVNTRSLMLKAANFRISGSAPADALANVGLYVNGVKVGNNAVMTMANGSNYLSFDLMSAPKELTTGSHTIEVRADVVKGSSFNFTVALQQASDVMVYDNQVGVNVAISSFTASTAALITIGAGSFTAVLDPTFNTFTNVTGGASNSTIAKFKLRGYGEDVKVTSLPVTPVLPGVATTYSSGTVTTGSQSITVASTTGVSVGQTVTIAGATAAVGTVTSVTSSTVFVANITTGGVTPAGAVTFTTNGLQNVTLYFNGVQVGSQQNWTSGALTFNLGSQLIVPAGVDSMLEVRADLRTTGGTNYTAGTVSANLGAASAEGVNSKSSVTGPTATGNTLTMQTGLLAVAKNAGYANQSLNPNTAGVKIGSFVLQNQSSSEAVRVTSLAVALTGSTALTNLSGLRTSETSGSGAIPVQPQATNTFSVDFTLAAGATKTVDIFADTSSEVSVNAITTLAVTAIGATSNTSTSVAAVTGQTISLSAGTLATPTLTASSSTAAQYVAAAGGLADGSKGTYNFVSTGGGSTITELKFTITGGVTPVTSVKVGNVTAPVVAGVAWLQGLNLAVPNGGSGLSIDAMYSYSDVGTSGEVPGVTATGTLTYVKYSSGGSSTVLTPSVASNTMTLVGSKPTISVSSTQASGLNISGVGKIGEVTVTADAKGNIKVNTMVFTVASSGFSTAPTAVAGTILSDSNSSSSPISGVVCTPASLVVTCTLDTDVDPATGFDGYTIAAGTSKTFSLFGSLTGAAATGSGVPTITSSIAASTFNWDDSSTNGGAGSINLTGSLIYGFPNASFSIKQ